MDLNTTQMFVSVVRVGSLSRAAAKIGVPLATVSRRIRALERELGVQLLQRSARGTKLTDAGARLFEQASAGIDALVEAEHSVRRDQALVKGTLRLSLPPGFEPWWALIGAFQRRHPDVDVATFTTERAVDLIEEGIDVSLRVGAVVHENVIARRLGRYRHVLVAAPALLRRLGEPASPEALRALPCGVWRPMTDRPRAWQLGKESVRPNPVIVVNDYAHLRERALAGDIVTELPPFLAREGLRTGKLVAVLPDWPLPEQQVHLIYPAHRHLSAIVRAYLDFCQEHAKPLLSGTPSR